MSRKEIADRAMVDAMLPAEDSRGYGGLMCRSKVMRVDGKRRADMVRLRQNWALVYSR